MNNKFRKNNERSLPAETNIVRINPKMDIIAMGLVNGDVAIHRLLSWQRVSVISYTKTIKVNRKLGNEERPVSLQKLQKFLILTTFFYS